jgi:hypothetical protein
MRKIDLPHIGETGISRRRLKRRTGMPLWAME